MAPTILRRTYLAKCRSLLLRIWLPIKPTTRPIRIQATKAMAEFCCRLDMSIPSEFKLMADITFPSLKSTNDTAEGSVASFRLSTVR
jgi:hypothetical protein